MFFNLLQMFISEREDCWTEVVAPERQRGSATRWHPNDAINGHNVCQGITALAITLCLPACISDTEPPACCSMLLTLVGQAKPSPFSSSSFKLQFNWGQDYFPPMEKQQHLRLSALLIGIWVDLRKNKQTLLFHSPSANLSHSLKVINPKHLNAHPYQTGGVICSVVM